MGQVLRKTFSDKYRAVFLVILVLVSFRSYSQTYNPSLHVVINSSMGEAQAAPLDARSMLYDQNLFLYRPYQSTGEVLSYLNLPKYRYGNFFIIIDSGGTLQSNGTFIGGTNTVWMFKDSTTNAGLIKLNLLGTGGCAGCLLAANNLSDLSNAGLARSNLGLGTMATQSTTAIGTDITGTWPAALTVAKFNGQLPSYYLNYANLTNTPAPLTLTTSGSSGSATYNSGTGVLNIPIYGGGSGGYCLNCNADTIANIPITLGPIRNNYVLTLDSAGGYFYLAPGGGSSGGGTVTSVAMTVPSSLLAVSGSPINSTGTFAVTLANASAYNVWGNGTNATATPGYFTPNATILNSWFGGTIQSQLTLTTAGSSGAATLTGSTLNIPNYAFGSTNSNIGAGYRFAVPGTNNIKTLFCSGCTLDSTTNTNGITLTVTGGGPSTPDTIHLSAYGTGINLLSTNTAGSILYHKTGENSTTNSITANSDSSFSVNSLLAGSNSISISGASVSFLNDAATPGAWALYGPNGSATKGWNAFTGYPVATLSANGLFSSAEKARLDSTIVEVNALQYPTLDSLVTVNVAQDTLTYKRLQLVAGAGITITDSGNLYKNSYAIAVTGGGSGITPGAGLTYYPNTSTLAIDSIWQGRKVVIAPIAQNNIYESSIIVDSNSALLGVPSTQHILKGIFTSGWTTLGLYYGESSDSGITWTFWSGNPFSSTVGYCRSSIHKKGDSLIVYAVPATTGLNRVDRFAMLASGTPALNSTNTGVITEGGGSNSFKQNGVDNNWVYYDSDSSAYYMMLDGFNGNLGYQDGVFKSTDDVHWTQFSPNGVTNITGPWFTKINGVYWLWGHRSPAPSTSFTFLPTDGYRAYSTDLIHWTPYPVEPTLRRITQDEGVDSTSGQVADLMMVPWGNSIFMFYDGTPNGLVQGAAIPGLQIKRVEFQGTLTQLIATRENASITNQWQSFSNPANDLPELYTMGTVAVQTFPDTAAWMTLGAGTPQFGALRFDLTSARPRTVLAPGLFEAVNDYLLYTDSAKVRDTIAMRSWVEANVSTPGFENVIHNNNVMTVNDTVQSGGHLLFVSGYFGATNIELDASSSSSFLALNNGQLYANTGTTQPAINIGGETMGAYSAVNQYLGFNIGYLSGTLSMLGNGEGAVIQGVGGGLYFGIAPSVGGSGAASITYPLFISPSGSGSGNVTVNSGEQDWGTGALQSNGTTIAQLALHYNSSLYAQFLVGGAGALNLLHLTSLTLPTAAIPAGSSSDTVLVIETSGGTSTIKKAVFSGGGSTSLYAANGVKAGGTDSIYLGGPLNQATLINFNGFALSTTNMPSKSTAAGTDSVLDIDAAGKWWKLPVPSGGGGSVSSVSNSDGTLTISPTTGSVVASLALAHANTWTAAQTLQQNGIATTVTDAAYLQNTTAATSSVTAQYSPALHFEGTGWVTGSTASQVADAKIYILTASGSSQPSNTLYFDMSHNGGSATHVLELNEGSGATVVGYVSASGVVACGTTSGFNWGNVTTTPGLFSDSNYSFSARQGTHAEEFRLMNTFTAVGNQGFFRISHQVTSNVVTIGPYAYGAAPTETVTAVGTWTFASAPILTTSSTVGQAWIATGTSGQGGWGNVVTSGTYTATITTVSNCTSPSSGVGHYTRNGNQVSVDIPVTVNLTVTATATEYYVSLPVSSTISSGSDLTGMGTSVDPLTSGLGISGNTTNHVADVTFTPTGTGSNNMYLHYTYTVD